MENNQSPLPSLGICKYCNSNFKGRSNQRYCSPICKTIVNNQLAAIRNEKVKESVQQYKSNVQLMEQLWNNGKHSISEIELLELGFKKGIHQVRNSGEFGLGIGYEEFTLYYNLSTNTYILTNENDEY